MTTEFSTMRIGTCSRKNTRLKVLVSFFSIVVCLGIGTLFSKFDINRNTDRETVRHAPIDSIYAMAEGFEPDVVSDFPSANGARNRIPRIMHQMWISDEVDKDTSDIINVPTKFEASVKSFFNIHCPAKWKYMFWNRKKARTLITERYEWFLPVFDSYSENILKGDVLRYIVLYEFGGVYADLDLTFLRPLDRVTVKYPCVLTLEPFEHPVLFNGQPYRLNNNLIFCRRGHPFMKFLIDTLPYARMMVNNLDISGPSFITMCYLMYSKLSKDEMFHASQKEYQDGVEPFFYKGSQTFKEGDSLYMANTQFFSLPVDNADNDKCNKSQTLTLVQRMCAYLAKRSFPRTINNFTFTKHAWANSNISPQKFKKTIELSKNLMWNANMSNCH